MRQSQFKILIVTSDNHYLITGDCYYPDSGGRHIKSNGTPPGDRPTVIKTDQDGNEISYYDIRDNTWQAIISTLNWFGNSTIALGGSWTYEPSIEGISRVVIVDKDFNQIDQ